MNREKASGERIGRSRSSWRGLPLLLLVFAGCVLRSYSVDPPGAAGAAGAAGGDDTVIVAGEGGALVSTGGSSSGAGPAAGSAPRAGSGGQATHGGASGMAGADTLPEGGAPPVICDSTEKKCGDACVKLADVTYGCTTTSCNQSACPTGGATLGCSAGQCVITSCATGSKKCGDKCVAVNDPTYGCSASDCSAAACPDPGTGTVACSGTACVIGTCKGSTKQCGNKCVPLDATNGCANPNSCSACASNETCTGSPTSCQCVADNVEACKGKACGPAINNCGTPITCNNTCTLPNTCGGGGVDANSCGCADTTACNGKACGSVVDKCNKTVSCTNQCSAVAPICLSNQCAECNAASDCPNNVRCAQATCTNHVCGLSPVAANTACAAGGTCSTSTVGICTRSMIDASGFSVDATPVTRAQYRDFIVAKNGSMAGQVAMCNGVNTTYTPAYDYPPEAKDFDMPQAFVDLCDAKAYCSWTGKHLCGRIGGVAGGWINTNPDLDEWTHACVGASKTVYPYGNSYISNECLEANQPELVGTHNLCVGGYQKLFDMAGNVFEWEDQCSGSGTQANPYYCTTRGNGFFPGDGQTGTRCDNINAFDMSTKTSNLGFRCCK